MELATRWLLAALVAFTLPTAALAQDDEPKLESTAIPGNKVDLDRIREELGVNGFTAPSIENLLAELMELRPIPIEKLWRDVPPDMPDTRAKIALRSGRIIADGLLAIIAEKPSRVEAPARALLRYAKALGIGDHVTSRSKSLMQQVANQNWLGLRQNLVKSQADIESGMMALKDEEIAHMVSLGGWFRGLEAVSFLVDGDYTPEHAKILVQPEAIEYFLDRLSTLDPMLREDAVFQAIEKNLKAIQAIVAKEGDAPPTADEVKDIRKRAAEVVDLL